jgi:hypothetical protein
MSSIAAPKDRWSVRQRYVAAPATDELGGRAPFAGAAWCGGAPVCGAAEVSLAGEAVEYRGQARAEHLRPDAAEQPGHEQPADAGEAGVLVGEAGPGRVRCEPVWETPALRAYQSDMMDQFTSMAAGILAARAGMRADHPEPQVAAAALLGLWRIQYRALPRYLDGARTPAEVRQAVTADAGRAARLDCHSQADQVVLGHARADLSQEIGPQKISAAGSDYH